MHDGATAQVGGGGGRRWPVVAGAAALALAAGLGVVALVARSGDDEPALAPGLDPSLSAATQASLVVLGPDDGPAGFDWFGPGLLTEEPLCPAAAPLSDQTPAGASDLAAFHGSGQRFTAKALVLPEREQAIEALEIDREAFRLCSEPAGDGGSAALTVFPWDDVDIPGADEVYTVAYSYGPSATRPAEWLAVCRVSNVNVIATGTDPGRTQHFARVMTARAAGLPEPSLVDENTG